MKHLFTIILVLISISFAAAQDAVLNGVVQDGNGKFVEFVNVALYRASDSTLVKVETSGQQGAFAMRGIGPGEYYLEATCLGLDNLSIDGISLGDGEQLDLGTLTMQTTAVELEEAVVTADRAIVEVKPDRTVFNVQGTINATGDDALNLLRKAPGVLVDNSENITVLSRTGVMLYIDGKRLPLSGDDLTNYLKNIPAEQIDKIDIITSPGAKYEAEGSAGIIDIRMKRDKSLGANGSVSGSVSQGVYFRGNLNASANYRNKLFNTYAQVGYGGGNSFSEMFFHSFQNGIESDERLFQKRDYDNYNYRWGTDFFVGKNHTIGFLLTGNYSNTLGDWDNRVELGQEGSGTIDSILVADNMSKLDNTGNTYNINYAFKGAKSTLNIDADYGRYNNTEATLQPNVYYNPGEDYVTSEVNTAFDTDTEIDIYTFVADFETDALGGKLGLGTKLSKVATDNTYLFYNIIDEERAFDDGRSNRFVYDEMVYAGYVNFARSLGEKWNMSAGLRLEQTDSRGDLKAFRPDLQEPPVEQNYLSAFPSLGFTYQLNQQHVISANYGRRINRPDYNVLNPFDYKISELSYRKGNPFLKPEIVNNVELGYTLKYRYNFKLSYSRTKDQITRLIGPDENDPRAGFITWDNLASQEVYAFNASAPVDIAKWWNMFANLSISHINNQADYGNGAIVDIQRWSYNIYMQHTFKLPWKLTGEVSGWYSGPGVWGGVFKYDPSFSLNLGLQRRFLEDRMNVRLTVNDIFFESYWSGTSSFNGLNATGRGYWDSRRVSLSVSMNFGNQNVKSRKRQTGIEAEANRVGSDN